MSKKHFVWMADYIKNLTQDDIAPWENVDNAKQTLAAMAMKMGRDFNPNFDEVVFLKACGLSK